MKIAKLLLAIICSIAGVFEICFLWSQLDLTPDLIILGIVMTLGILFASSVLWINYLENE